MPCSPEFESAAAAAQAFTSKPTDDELLELYGLFKQATMGDVKTCRPDGWDLKAKYKWDAWNDNVGKTQQQAEQLYIEKVEALKVKHG